MEMLSGNGSLPNIPPTSGWSPAWASGRTPVGGFAVEPIRAAMPRASRAQADANELVRTRAVPAIANAPRPGHRRSYSTGPNSQAFDTPIDEGGALVRDSSSIMEEFQFESVREPDPEPRPEWAKGLTMDGCDECERLGALCAGCEHVLYGT